MNIFEAKRILHEAGLVVEFLGLSGDEKAEKLKKAIIEEAPKYRFTLGKDPDVFYKDKKYKVFLDIASWKSKRGEVEINKHFSFLYDPSTKRVAFDNNTKQYLSQNLREPWEVVNSVQSTILSIAKAASIKIMNINAQEKSERDARDAQDRKARDEYYRERQKKADLLAKGYVDPSELGGDYNHQYVG